jgi:hypothetical protein
MRFTKETSVEKSPQGLRRVEWHKIEVPNLPGIELPALCSWTHCAVLGGCAIAVAPDEAHPGKHQAEIFNRDERFTHGDLDTVEAAQRAAEKMAFDLMAYTLVEHLGADGCAALFSRIAKETSTAPAG